MLHNPMFRLLKLSCLGALALPMGALASSCSNMSDKCENTNTCAGLDADAGDAGSCADPSTQPCAISNARGLFVSAATGSDTDGAADGTREKPFRSVGKALATARVQKKNVYVCAGAGDYTEVQTLTIDAAFTGVSLFGGFNCADWTYATTLKAKIVSSSPNAIIVDGVTSGMQLADFEVQAADATQLGTSSLAVQVRSSQSVTLRRVKVTAGRGAAGAPGMPGGKGADGVAGEDAKNGRDAYCPTGLQPALRMNQPGGISVPGSACGSIGGKGGGVSAVVDSAASDGESGLPRTNLAWSDVDNAGKGEAAGGSNKQGGEGSPGNPGPDALAADEVGTWMAGGYAPASGRAGTNGSPGQGGGGGGASKSNASCVGASGGAGGMGGCGGGAGQGGGGGGASVALFVWQSGVTIEACELIARDGGVGRNGGDGGQGGGGAGGGAGGRGAGTAAAGGRGGDGGTGGGGGSGSGGTGGASYALVSHGNAVTQVGNNSLTAGSGGAAGAGGSLIGLGVDPAPPGSVGANGKQLVCSASVPCVSRP
ncbi:MAG TPA: hypothetical protein VI072_11070 [Polyangiaceae bacterium]